MLSLGLQSGLGVEQLVASLQILGHTFIIVVKEHTSLVVLVVDLLEVAVLAATLPLLFDRALKLGQVALVADQEGVLPQVLVRVKVVRLNGLARQFLAEELHLGHLVLVETLSVHVVWVGIR